MPATRKPSPVDTYRTHLEQLPDWDDYLRQESRLPGPRANLELLEAVIQAGNGCRFAHLLALDSSFPDGAPANTPDEFLTVCAVAGLGKLVAEGDRAWLSVLRRRAADPRWRVREAVAIALQHWGDHDMPALVDEMGSWSSGCSIAEMLVVRSCRGYTWIRPIRLRALHWRLCLPITTTCSPYSCSHSALIQVRCSIFLPNHHNHLISSHLTIHMQ